MNRADYDYNLPPELIASTPLAIRDSSRLFVYHTTTDTVELDLFSNIKKYIPSDSFLVVNETKVLPARVRAKKETGGEVELLFLVNEWKRGVKEIDALSDRKIVPGMVLALDETHSVRVASQNEKIFSFEMLFDPEEFEKLLLAVGVTPVPKYLGDSGLSESELRVRYQTVFAERAGSVAAPTASLHFTPELLHEIENAGIARYPVTLHVGLGTFSPFTPEQLARRELFREQYEISDKSVGDINGAKASGKKCVAVGTTATRALESASQSGQIVRNSGETSLFIAKPYEFQMVDHLITNFHLPGSSLMLLVDAFLVDRGAKRSLRDLYEIAIGERMRFFSFGDAMLIL